MFESLAHQTLSKLSPRAAILHFQLQIFGGSPLQKMVSWTCCNFLKNSADEQQHGISRI